MLTMSVVVAAATASALAVTGAPPGDARSSTGRLFVVQAVPGTTYDVSLDGEQEQSGVETGTVVGPLELRAGQHEVRFDPDDGQPLTATVSVRAGSSKDLVLHLPADPGGAPVADTYGVSTKPVAPDMARVLVAHTATVPPADVRVDGKVVFEDIANGEFAQADVPAGPHEAAILPAGTTGDPILGPLDVDLPAGTVTMVYAVGSPTNGSMNVISHRAEVPTSAAGSLRAIHTGSAGLVRSWRVAAFGR
ncbi:hypothetical protein ASC77_02140 [Nocardioides sp. Root1257]|nr:hypothetical protein ASC77_02140 [Nocardioides sp. Root1257]KRC55810.1 hypothetical protein ASE24_02140 [Nocardioides sp. Root224]